jgi:hypothetical protein
MTILRTTKLDKMLNQDAGVEAAGLVGIGAGRVRTMERRHKRTG